MTTSRHVTRRRPAVLGAVVLAFAALSLAAATAAAHHFTTFDAEAVEEFHEELAELGFDGSATGGLAFRPNDPLAIEAAFDRESYRPGATARLRFWSNAAGVTLQFFQVGPERMRTRGDSEMRGVPVTSVRRLGAVQAGAQVAVRVGQWQSGLYFARLSAPGGHAGFAPFVVRPQRLGEHPVAVVLPTRTWQAYNMRDDDGDGGGDTWYATLGRLTARLHRPFLNRGVPPYFRKYDLHFLRWLQRTGKDVDVLSQAELDESPDAAVLRRAYRLIVFPGHHEYVTENEYDAIEGFRDRGGSLVFLSANNFFWRIDVRGDTMTRVAKWRELGRPEASVLGVQYVANDLGEHRGPWLVRRSQPAARWLFRGVEFHRGTRFSNGGIEIDMLSPSSPRGTQVLATIPDLLGPGLTAQMSYYETARGARVFSAGAFSLAGSIRQPTVGQLLENLWARFATTPSAE